MKFLFLSYYFPPIKSIASLRAWQWSRHLLPFAEKIFIITTKNRHLLAKEPRPTEGVEIHEATTFDYRTLAAKRNPNPKSVHFDEQQKASFLMRFFIKLKNTIPFNFFIGEGGFFYILSSVFISYQLIKKHKIKYIISSFPPYADHYSAWILKIIFRKKIVWIADFRDPHIHPLYHQYFWLGFQQWANHALMSKADMLTTTSEGFRKSLLHFNSTVYTIRNAFTYQILNQEKYHIYTHKFCIAYTGSMYPSHKPLLLFEVLKDIFNENPSLKTNFQIIYAGKDSNTWKQYAKNYNIEEILESKGNVNQKEAMEIQQQSHVNILLTSSLSGLTGILTGKLYEYLAARRPIIALINGVQDIEFENIIHYTEGGIVAYHQSKESYFALKIFLLYLFSIWQKDINQFPFIEKSKLKKFTWDFQIEVFLEILKSQS